MDFIRGVSRDQATLFPERLDDYIDEENPVRFIDVFVDNQDMKALGFQRIEPAWTGRSLMIREICSSSTSMAISIRFGLLAN